MRLTILKFASPVHEVLFLFLSSLHFPSSSLHMIYFSLPDIDLRRFPCGRGLLISVDGLVLTLTPYSHNYNYRSSILHGTATLLDPLNDPSEKLFAMQLITNHVFPSRWTDSRTPPTKTELTSTGIIRVDITSAS